MSKPRWGGAPSDKCLECGKTVYPAEKLVMEGRIFHIKCLKCTDELCGKFLTGANWGGFMPPDDKPYCKIHFDRIVISSGKGGVSSASEWVPKEKSEGDSSPSSSRWGGAPNDKCEECGKTVYPAEKLVMGGKVFHNGSCLKCHECSKYLSGANWGGFVPSEEEEGKELAYCKTHHDQLVARAGGSTKFHRAAEWTPKTSSESSTPSRWGGAPKEKCEKCGKTVYPAEKVSMEGRIFHAPCLRCTQCGKALCGANFGNFVPPDNDPYCKVHYDQMVARIGDSTKLSGSHMRG